MLSLARRRATLGATMAVLAAAVPAAATVPVHNGAKMVLTGDSLTAFGWETVAGGLIDQINAQLVPFQATYTATAGTGNVAASAGAGNVAATFRTVTVPPVHVQTVNTGIPGSNTVDLQSAVTSRITQYSPDIVVILLGRNDQANPPSTTQAATHSVNAQIRAWSSTAQIVWVSVMWLGSEKWVSTPSLQWGDGNQTPTTVYNTMIQSECALVGPCTYADANTPALLYESLNNTPEPGAAFPILTGDGTHPNATGQKKMGDWTISYFQVLP